MAARSKVVRLCQWLDQVDENALPWGPFKGQDAAHTLAELIRAVQIGRTEAIAHGAKAHPECKERDCRYVVCAANRALKQAHELAKWALG